MSLYGDYLKERTEDFILEDVSGFVTYRYIGEKTLYIVDIYVKPEVRHAGYAKALADEVIAEAKKRGCNRLVGTVVPSTKGANLSLRGLWDYGLKVESAGPDCIVMAKEI